MRTPDYRHLFDPVPSDDADVRRLRQILSVATMGVMLVDPAGTVVAANDALLRWTGLTREQVSGGLHWRTLLPPERHPGILDQVRRLEETGHFGPFETEYPLPGGSPGWLLFVGSRLEDGTVVVFVRDIGIRKAAERRRRESETRYRKLFDSIEAGFCVLEMLYDAAGRPVDYRFLEVNPAFERQTGLRDATEKTMREHAPQHEQRWFDLYHEVASTGKPQRFVQHAAQLGGGLWYDVYAFALEGEGRNKIGVLFNDISDRVRAEQALREAARRKDEFLATLSHELRNPLAPIQNALSILRLAGPAEPVLQDARDVIDRQLSQLVRLVDDLLDVSRITFGKVTLQRERLDLRQVARDAAGTSEPLVAAASHTLELRLAPAPVWVDGDRVRLSQVIANLLNNAARYTPAGGRIELSVAERSGEALIAVQDTGLGLEPAMLERIFEPFAQARTAGDGIGIGLSLARALVELHGGRIKASSGGLGQGSRFTVALPLAAAPAQAEPAQAREVPAVTRRRFLVVDDNVDATVSQATMLRLLGHEVETAFSGPEALDKARVFRPDIVLLDLGMPRMDGFEVARRLRAAPEGRGVLLVAQTGWGQEEHRKRTREAGFDAHLAKPVDIEALLRLVATASPAEGTASPAR